MARGMQWNAMSQAAKKGYSHLSGCRQIRNRTEKQKEIEEME
jgi:hypothetical protein